MRENMGFAFCGIYLSETGLISLIWLSPVASIFLFMDEKKIMKVGFQKRKRGICEMARQAKALARKLDKLNLIDISP